MESFLSGKVSDFLLAWRVISITVDKLYSSSLNNPTKLDSEWETLRKHFEMESPSSTSIPVLRVYTGIS